MMKILSVIGSALVVSACSLMATGYSSQPYKLEKLLPGVTTFQESVRLYGNPAITEMGPVAIRATYYFRTPESVVDTSEMMKGSYIDGCKNCGKLKLAFARSGAQVVLQAYAIETKALYDRYVAALELLQKGDYVGARPALEMLAKEHYADAEFNLAMMCLKGDGGPQDYPQARQLLGRAAGTGHVGAMYDLAAMYRNAEGGSQDLTLAKVLFTEAANRGHGGASAELAKIYYEEGDMKKAEYWLDVAKRKSAISR